MARVICKLPNASEEISGVKFEKHDDGMLSEEIGAEAAARFASIPGYELVAAVKAPPKDDADVNGDGVVDLTDLVARATALGVSVKANWKAARLTSAIERAESAAADDADATGKTE